MKQISLILIGGGDRGSSYIKYLDTNPDKFKLVGIAEPVKEKREYLRDTYNVPADMCFESYEDLLALPKMADVAMICTQDQMHFAPAMMAIEKKYDLLLEKPAAATVEECFKISVAAKKHNVKVLVCHVLRYTPFYKALKKLIDDGAVGEIMNIEHSECVGNLHYSHSYVRGNWRKLSEASPMILAKCCHDTDLMQWLLGEQCTKVQSFGTLSYFKKENAPEGAAMRCLDDCPHKDTCFYYAPKMYKIRTAEVGHFRGIVAKKFNPTDEEVDEILKTSQYGRCVYHCDNDVVDHQTVNMLFGKDKSVTLTMSAFNKGGRYSKIMGTKGEIHADFEEQSIMLFDFETRERKEMYEGSYDFEQSIAGGHGGGDSGIMEDLYEYVANGVTSNSISGIDISCMSHLVAFAAEEARVTGKVIDMDEYVKSLKI